MLALLCLGACTEFEPGDDVLQSEDQQLLDGEPAAGEDWGCVDPGALGAEDLEVVTAADEGARLVQPLQFLTLGRGLVPPNGRVRVCSRADVDCLAPIAEGYELSADGWVNLELRAGFNGYLEVTADGVLPTMVFLGGPLRRARPANYPVALVERQILPGVSGATGTVQNDTSGLLALRVFDCQDTAGAGVSFDQDKEDAGVPWYFVDGLPSSIAQRTGPEGLGGFINTPPGLTVIESKARDGQVITARRSVFVRADWMTALRMWVGEEAP